MTWTAPTPPESPEGPLVGDDRTILVAFLAWERWTLLNICAGLTGSSWPRGPSLPRTCPCSGWSGTWRRWSAPGSGCASRGEPIGPMYDPALGKDTDFDDLVPDRAEADFASYDEECRLADAAAAALPFDDTFVPGGEEFSLRFVYVHMIAEYSRHNGHADLLRERLDGVTGR